MAGWSPKRDGEWRRRAFTAGARTPLPRRRRPAHRWRRPADANPLPESVSPALLPAARTPRRARRGARDEAPMRRPSLAATTHSRRYSLWLAIPTTASPPKPAPTIPASAIPTRPTSIPPPAPPLATPPVADAPLFPPPDRIPLSPPPTPS